VPDVRSLASFVATSIKVQQTALPPLPPHVYLTLPPGAHLASSTSAELPAGYKPVSVLYPGSKLLAYASQALSPLEGLLDSITSSAQAAVGQHAGDLFQDTTGGTTQANFYCDSGYSMVMYQHNSDGNQQAVWFACNGSNGPSDSLTLSPTSGYASSGSTLSWGASNASSCSITNVGAVSATGGAVAVYPSSTTTYTITCSNGNGGSASASATYTVIPNPPPTVSFSVSPNPLLQLHKRHELQHYRHRRRRHLRLHACV
jgi:hypothetical protein